MKKRLVRTATAVALAAAGAVAVPVSAQAGISDECIVSKYDAVTYRAWCGAAAPGSQFRIIVTCHNLAGAYYYPVYGTWRTQGGSYWSYAACGSGASVFGTSVGVR